MEMIHTDQLQPDILVGGLRIGEPVVDLTAVLMALVCLCVVPAGSGWRRGQVVAFVPFVFICMAVSGLIGGYLATLFFVPLSFFCKNAGLDFRHRCGCLPRQVSIERLRQLNDTLLWSALSILVLPCWLWGYCAPRAGFQSSSFTRLLVFWAWLGRQLVVLVTLDSPQQPFVGFHPICQSGGGRPRREVFLGPWFTFFDIGHLFMPIFWMIYQSALLHEGSAKADNQ